MFLATLIVAVCSAVQAEAGLDGEMEVGYVNFDSRYQGRSQHGSTFQHRYALLHSDKGVLQHGLLGRYQYALGYEWASFRSRITGDEVDITPSTTAGHVLFNGAIQLKPNKLPLRFDAYSRDLSRGRFLGNGSFFRSDIVVPGITTSLLDGTHIRS